MTHVWAPRNIDESGGSFHDFEFGGENLYVIVVLPNLSCIQYQLFGRSITVHKVVLPNSDLQIVLFITYTALLSERWRQIDLACNLISSIIC